MKTITKKFMLAGGILFGGLALSAQTARLQVIHNSADAAAATVDVWINDTLLAELDDFAFRTATPFIDAPAGTPFDITICGPGSTDTTNEVKRFSGLTLMAGETYVAVANGIVSTTGYSPIQPFDLDLYTMGQEAANVSTNTDLLVCHGSTDAPNVDVVAVGAGTLIEDLAYGTFNMNYLELATLDYNIQIRNDKGTDVVAEYSAPLQTLNLDGVAAVVVASGFLDPTVNSNGDAFGLWVALPAGGALVQLPQVPVSTARVQVIHNCADAAAEFVDIWLNDGVLANNFEFRTATKWIDAPAGVPFDLTISDSASADTTNEVARFSFDSLQGGMKYVIVANGIVSPTGYSPAKPFTLDIYDMGREVAANSANTDLLVVHGSTDAPTVDVTEAFSGNILVDNASYTDFSNYIELPTNNYSVSIVDSASGTVVQSYAAPLQGLSLGGQAITVLASGFLTPTNNSNGPAFGLWVALSSGGPLVQLSVVTSVEEQSAGIAYNVFPNPAADQTTIAYTLEQSAQQVLLTVSDMSGRVVYNADLGTQSAGFYQQPVQLNNLSEGIYITEMVVDGKVSRQRIVVNR